MDIREAADQLGSKIERALPEGLAASRQDLHNNIRALIQESFGKLDLVTREEFDRQTEVLAQTRNRLEMAQKQLDLLEAQLEQNKPFS